VRAPKDLPLEARFSSLSVSEASFAPDPPVTVDPPDSQLGSLGSSDAPPSLLLVRGNAGGRSFQPLELPIDCVGDRGLRAVLIGMLRETDR
jgi:hypothetical protein